MRNVSCCGTDCDACEYYGAQCAGCNACQGKVFYTPEKACPIYECVRNQKGLKNCGQCKELPCAIWKKTRDPQFTDEEFEENIASRVKMLQEEQ